MTRRILVPVSGILLSFSGLTILGMAGNPILMGLFGSPTLSVAQAGDPGWVGVGFMRVFGTALASLGLIMMAAKQLPDGAAEKIGGPIFVGLALLTVITAIQAHAVWNTPGGWVLTLILLVGCMGAGQLTRTRSE